MYKTILPTWSFGDDVRTRVVKNSSRGLIGDDKVAFYKHASPLFQPWFDSHKVAADEELVHAIALGAYEFWGANRNADAFKVATCRDYCKTFEKYAKAYRWHESDDPENSYGAIKAAVYNPDMARVELLIGYNKTASAARRNKGKIADLELEKLARGDDLPLSMGCSIDYDQCSWCENKARTRKDYCSAERCKAGGCRDNLGKLVKVGNDTHRIVVFNPHPRWKDISLVVRGADPTAWGARADWSKMAADTDECLGSAKLAELLGVHDDSDHAVPVDMTYDQSGVIHDLTHGLSLIEKHAEVNPVIEHGVDTPEFDVAWLGVPGSSEFRQKLAALADAHIILTPRDYFRAMGKKASGTSDNLFQTILSRHFWGDTAPLAFTAIPRNIKKHAEALAPTHGLAPRDVQRRIYSGLLLAKPFTKSAAVATPDQTMIEYGLYKIASLYRIAENNSSSENSSHFALTAQYAVAQNRVV